MTGGAYRALFTLTVFVGSFLLFLIQPMTARMALPVLGGAPNVWNSAMLVYQLLLLGGYAYAHWLSRMQVRRQATIHVILLLGAAFMLPIALPGIGAPASGWEFVWVPWLFLLTVGPVFFIVSAQAPLMQRWYASDPQAGDPYPLYAASNLGSFAGLLTYPLLAEPLLAIGTQSLAWAGGYALLVLLVFAVSRTRWQARGEEIPEGGVQNWRPGWRKVGLWLALAAVPSALMLSTTTYLTTDIMAMPLLWVIPLGLYLLSFSVAFAEGRTAARWFTIAAPPVILIGILFTFGIGTAAPLLAAALSILTLFVGSVALHARMYDSRPDPRHLTGFYLIMSAGGAIGGAFTALAAPLMFSWTWEHPLLIMALALLLPLDPFAKILERFAIRTVFLRAAIVLAVIALMGMSPLFDRAFTSDEQHKRSYFGVYTIDKTKGDGRLLVHGTTAHGFQRGHKKEPTTYYGRNSGAGLALQSAPELYGEKARIGVVGLGAGVLACYHRPGQDWTFYEIDPVVLSYSQDGTFSFLDQCTPDVPVVIGDARIKLAEAPADSFDMLLVDAFSSDSIPLHLVTADAVEVYRRALAENGLLLIHVSNRHFDLAPVFSALVGELRLSAAMRHDDELANEFLTESLWIAISSEEETLARLTDDGNWSQLPEPTGPLWTDDFASVLPYLKWGEDE